MEQIKILIGFEGVKPDEYIFPVTIGNSESETKAKQSIFNLLNLTKKSGGIFKIQAPEKFMNVLSEFLEQKSKDKIPNDKIRRILSDEHNHSCSEWGTYKEKIVNSDHTYNNGILIGGKTGEGSDVKFESIEAFGYFNKNIIVVPSHLWTFENPGFFINKQFLFLKYDSNLETSTKEGAINFLNDLKIEMISIVKN
jgi:hypothetical protein